MSLKRIAIIAAGTIALSYGSAKAQTTYVEPYGNGGYTITQPGSGQPPVYVQPYGSGGYVATQPGEPPTYIQPYGLGGYGITQPGAGVPDSGDSQGQDDGEQ